VKLIATSGPDSRTTQLFINFKDNECLDDQGFSTVAEVVEGLDEVVVWINSEYHEQPNQGEIQSQGNTYLDMKFPRLTYITDAHIRGA
jgi:cyclophilin family peptidyl-prolyl cis-trans isomerase